jgi:DNA invertase Pin-like site-specific DNA recombinase
VEARASAGSSTPWAQLLALIQTLQTGDRLMVSELARLGRSLGQMVQIVERLLQRGVRLVAMKDAIRFEGQQTLQIKAMIAIFGLFPKVERDLIVERTRKGLAAARAKRKRLGRPKGAWGSRNLMARDKTSNSSYASTSPKPPLHELERSLPRRFITSLKPISSSPAAPGGAYGWDPWS